MINYSAAAGFAQPPLYDLSNLRILVRSASQGVSSLPVFDSLDARLLIALTAQPRATTLGLAETTGASRNTVQARLARFDDHGVLASFEHRINPASFGYRLTAFVTIVVKQQQLNEVGAALAQIPEVLEVYGLSGPIDLLARVVAHNADDLYRIAGQILATPGVERTETALTMRRMLDYRVGPLLERAV